jgi:hypothetical protein
MSGKDWLAWHDDYDRPDSRLAHRLELVQAKIRSVLDTCPSGPIRAVSFCAGQGRDLLGALADHPRRDDVTARLVELDDRNVDVARATVRRLGLHRIDVVGGDAASTDAYAGAVPAELVLTCGVFGNISDDDVRAIIDELPGFCTAGASVIWTRARTEADRLTKVDGWFQATGFERISLEHGAEEPPYGVGVHRFVGEPRPLRMGVTMFAFRPDRQAAPR